MQVDLNPGEVQLIQELIAIAWGNGAIRNEEGAYALLALKAKMVGLRSAPEAQPKDAPKGPQPMK